MNLAVGGDGGGKVPASFSSATMLVDYVRVWLTVKRLVSVVVLIVVGVSLVLAAAYKVTDPFAGARQSTAQQDLARSWRQPAVSPPAAVGTPGCTPSTRGVPLGRVFALIQIPAFGPNWKFTLIEGTGLPQLATGPGHIPGHGLPGTGGEHGYSRT